MANVPHTLKQWSPGASVSVYLAAKEEPRRVRGEAPVSAPIETVTANASGVASFAALPARIPLLARGTRADGSVAWIGTEAVAANEVKPVY